MDFGGEIKSYSDLRVFDKYLDLFLKDTDLKVYKFKLPLENRKDYEEIRKVVTKYKKDIFHSYRRILAKENAKKELINLSDFEEVLEISKDIEKLEKKALDYRQRLDGVSDLLIFERDLLDLYVHMREVNISW